MAMTEKHVGIQLQDINFVNVQNNSLVQKLYNTSYITVYFYLNLILNMYVMLLFIENILIISNLNGKYSNHELLSSSTFNMEKCNEKN